MTIQPLPPTACDSELSICSTGQLRGGLAGTLAFTGTSLAPTMDTPSTGVSVLTGDTVMTVSGGTLRSKDAAVTRQGGTGDFAEVITILGGTEK